MSCPEVNLAPSNVDNGGMGYIFEELISIGAEQANEEAGEHWGTGDLEITLNSLNDLEKAKPLLQRAYEGE